jgi:preprotein translocase subunit SecF
MPLTLIPDNTNIDFLGKRKIFYAVSIILMIGSIILCFTRGLNFGIDFTGGILIETQFQTAPQVSEVRDLLEKNDIVDVSLQTIGDPKTILIRIGQKTDKSEEQVKTIAHVKQLLNEQYNNTVEYRKIDYVGPKVGKELIYAGGISLLLSLIAMMIYIWFRFEWYFGLGGIIALLHDAILTFGFYSVTQLDFNMSSIAAILTIIGYSINDSVVIFDRIREDLRKYKTMPLVELINGSLNRTLSRTLLTSVTTILALIALVTLGGSVLMSFSAAALFGILIGTYSSIYVGTPVLIYMRLRNTKQKQ